MNRPRNVTVTFTLVGGDLTQLREDAEAYVKGLGDVLGGRLWSMAQGASGETRDIWGGLHPSLALEYAVEATFQLEGATDG